MVQDMDKIDKIKGFRSMGCNCSQSLLCTYHQACNLSLNQAFKLSEGIGFGLGRQHLCGAPNAMAIILGYLSSEGIEGCGVSKQKTYAIVSEAVKEFEQKTGSLLCSELKREGAITSCDDLILKCVELIETIQSSKVEITRK